jgi:PPOX class probable F420-dependent enzyme
MDVAEMRDRVAAARVGRLATVSANGGPHLVPFCFALLDDVVVTAVDHKPKRSTSLKRIENIAATGRACVLVDEWSEDWTQLWWVRLDCAASVVEDSAIRDRALAALTAKYAQYAATPPTGTVLALTVTRWTGWAASPGSGSHVSPEGTVYRV